MRCGDALASARPCANNLHLITRFLQARCSSWHPTNSVKALKACVHLTVFCPGLPRWAGTRKVKANLDFTEARDSEWQWHQLDHMQVCTSLQSDNHASTPPLSFLQARCPSCCPTNSVKALKAYKSTEGMHQKLNEIIWV